MATPLTCALSDGKTSAPGYREKGCQFASGRRPSADLRPFRPFLLPSAVRATTGPPTASLLFSTLSPSIEATRRPLLPHDASWRAPVTGEPHERFTPLTTNRCAPMAYTELPVWQSDLVAQPGRATDFKWSLRGESNPRSGWHCIGKRLTANTEETASFIQPPATSG